MKIMKIFNNTYFFIQVIIVIISYWFLFFNNISKQCYLLLPPLLFFIFLYFFLSFFFFLKYVLEKYEAKIKRVLSVGVIVNWYIYFFHFMSGDVVSFLFFFIFSKI